MRLTWNVALLSLSLVGTDADVSNAQTLTSDLYIAAKASKMAYSVDANADSHGPVAPTDTSELAKWYRDRLGCNSYFQRYNVLPEQMTYLIAARPGLVIVAFRGTLTDSNRAMNLRGTPRLDNVGMENVLSHTGWATAVNRIYPTIKRQIQLRDQNGTARIIVTGHSMGGAIAGYVTHRLLRDGMFGRRGYSRLMTFGSPRFSGERIFTDASLNEALAGANSKNLWLYSVETQYDPKLEDWGISVRAGGLLTFTVQRTGTWVDFKLSEIGVTDSTEAHNYSHYENIAKKRAGQ